MGEPPVYASAVALLHIFIRQLKKNKKTVNCAFKCSCTECPFLLCFFTVRSSSVFQDVGSANSMVICMFPRYILDWLSNLKPLTRTGKACSGTCGRKSICFIVKILCAETICINCRFSVWLGHSVLHALVPLAGPGGAAPVLMRHAVHQSTSVCLRPIQRFLEY